MKLDNSLDLISDINTQISKLKKLPKLMRLKIR